MPGIASIFCVRGAAGSGRFEEARREVRSCRADTGKSNRYLIECALRFCVAERPTERTRAYAPTSKSLCQIRTDTPCANRICSCDARRRKASTRLQHDHTTTQVASGRARLHRVLHLFQINASRACICNIQPRRTNEDTTPTQTDTRMVWTGTAAGRPM